MKKFLKLVFLSKLLCSTVTLQALPVGNPAEPSLLIDGVMFGGIQRNPCISFCDSVSLRTGFYGDYVFNRSLKTDVNRNFVMGAQFQGDTPKDIGGSDPAPQATSIPNAAYGQHFDNAELYTNAAFLALNVWDRFDIFCTLGAMNGYIKGNSKAFNLVGIIGDKNEVANTALTAAQRNIRPNAQLNQSVVELYTNTTFAWSIGSRATLWKYGYANLGAEFQYAQAKPKIETLNVLCNVAEFTINKPKGWVDYDVQDGFPLPPVGAKEKTASINYHEWQLGLALSYRFDMIMPLVPYVGLKFARANLDTDNIRIAQPELAYPGILSSTTWNPSIVGAAGDKIMDHGDINLAAYEVQRASLQINKMKSRKRCGLVLGTTLVNSDRASITGEARLIDEHAAHINVQVRF